MPEPFPGSPDYFMDEIAALRDEIIRLRAQLAEREKEIAELHDTASERRGEFNELERDYAHQRELLTDARATLAARDAALKQAREALWDTLRTYVDMANSGDCGFWDPEEETHVKQARAAIRAIDEVLK